MLSLGSDLDTLFFYVHINPSKYISAGFNVGLIIISLYQSYHYDFDITIQYQLPPKPCLFREWSIISFRECLTHWGRYKNGRQFPDDIFKCIFVDEKVWIFLKISLKFVSKFRIYNIPALAQIMAWRRSGDKPLLEQTMVSLLTHICVTLPQWVNIRANFGNMYADWALFVALISDRVPHWHWPSISVG